MKSQKEWARKMRRKDFGLQGTYWSIVGRCKYHNTSGYSYYGAKGIKVMWSNYKSFKKDMYDSYMKHYHKHGRYNTTIDRIDTTKNYCKENCRWATRKQQGEHRSDVKLYDGKLMKYYADKIGLHVATIGWRIRNGWTVEKAFTTPNQMLKYKK